MTPPSRLLRVMAVLALVLAPWAAWADPPECGRIVAVGDLHGGYDSLVTVLEKTRLIGADRRWRPDDACLVLVGDLVDRGERTRELLDFVMDLEKQAGGRLHVLLGNHEVMNIVGDLRYVTAAEFASFAGDETRKQRREGYDAFEKSRAAQGLDRGERKDAFERSFPPGWFAHRRAYAPEGRYGSWLLSQTVLLRLDDTLLVHGGVEPSVTALEPKALNDEILAEIVEYATLRERLVRAGWLDPLVPFGSSFTAVEDRLAPTDGGGEPAGREEDREAARRFLELRRAWFVRADGPLWSRKLADEDEEAYSETLDRMLRDLGVERVVVGHTTQDDHRIHARFDGRVFLIDTGAGPAYGGWASALEIEGDTVRAVYPDEVEVLVPVAEAALP